MKSLQKIILKTFLLLPLPVAMLFALRFVNWRRSHPSPTAQDVQYRTTLMAADRIEVTLDTWQSVGARKLGEDHEIKHITNLKPVDMKDVATYLNVTQECYPCRSGGVIGNPMLSFSFYKGSKTLGVFTIVEYGEYYYWNSGSTASWILDPTSISRLQEILKQHPELNFNS